MPQANVAQIPSGVQDGNTVAASWSGFMFSLGECEVKLMGAEVTYQRNLGSRREPHALVQDI